MKHIFIVNPCAGGHDSSGIIAAEAARLGLDAEIYITRAQRDAVRYINERCRTADRGPLRFYACGGDGTLNEVVSGAVGHADVEVACYPCGSGNDFVRYFGDADFHSLEALAAGTAREVDVVRIGIDGVDGYRYSVNTLNFGFEAAVCRTMGEVRRKPLIGGPMSYTTGIVCSLLGGRRNLCRVAVDGEPWLEGEVLLLSVANGQWAGGGYHCAPRAVANDGLLEVMAVKPMSIPRFASLIKYYKNGELLDREELGTVVSYRRGCRVTIDPLRDSYVATDGEIVTGRRFEATVLNKALHFVIPQH